MWLCLPLRMPLFFGNDCLNSSTFMCCLLLLLLFLYCFFTYFDAFLISVCLFFFCFLLFFFLSFQLSHFLIYSVYAWFNCYCFFLLSIFCIISRLFMYSMSTILIDFWHFDRMEPWIKNWFKWQMLNYYSSSGHFFDRISI